MTNSMESPIWWKKRSILERGLVVAAVSAILIIAGLAIALRIIAKETCVTPECLHTASTILENMDETVEPCDNFYRFACGSYLKKTIIPNDEKSISAFSNIREKLLEQLRSIIEDKYKPSDPKHFMLVKTVYEACMNTTAIEKQGLAPLRKRLKDLGGWPVLEGNKWNDDYFNWKESVYRFHKVGESVDYFMDFTIQVDAKNTTKHVIYVDEAFTGLPREYLTKGLSHKIVDAYYSYMVDIAVMLGADEDRAAKELKESLEFEIKLANISLPITKRSDFSALYNPMTVRELAQWFPTIPWLEYFNTLLAPTTSITEDELVIVNAPSFISEFERLLKQVPKRVQANYVMWRAVANHVSELSDEIRERQFAYYTLLYGKSARAPRWKECTHLVSRRLSLSVGALYARKYFNEEAKKKAMEMVSDIKEEFTRILKTVDWMDDETKLAALEKAKSISTNVAYPNELLDDNKLEEFYKKLEISPGNYFESMGNLSAFFTDYYFGKLRKPVNKSEWVNHDSLGWASEISSFYSSHENSIKLPVGILQEAFFNKDRPRYMNFGAIGYLIGHEITRGFDDRGRLFDKEGDLVDWWAVETKKKYLKRTECIISQYEHYTAPEVNVNLNGINTQDNNLADNGGIKQAYLAYNDWVRRNGAEPRLPGLNYNGQQMFWISAANMWCSKYRPEELMALIATGSHSPAEFRILGPMSNMPEFAWDFNCPTGSPMNPKKKCVIW